MAESQHDQFPEEAIIESVNKAGFFQLLGARVEQIKDGHGRVSITVDDRLMHPYMIVHGGLLFTLADTAMSMALISILPSGTPFGTIEAKINYLHPVREGRLVAEGKVVHEGRSTAVLEATIYNEVDDRRTPVARALGTFNIARGKCAGIGK